MRTCETCVYHDAPWETWLCGACDAGLTNWQAKHVAEPKSVPEIVAAWLKGHGFDGLAGDGCFCFAADLMPCEKPGPYDCAPGRREGEIIVTAEDKRKKGK